MHGKCNVSKKIVSRSLKMERGSSLYGTSTPVGIHRYALLLFRQKNPLRIDNPPEVRANFKTKNFVHQFDLGLPVACAYFNAQKEPMNKRP
ncbi:hypothetical protein AQUCO_00400416v1 [Aquilegia coerulea]|uniref:Uncharacterized protein n=1 Tax=Aquilegia coerulea TaxID=218851 RepID=A0A2G5EUU2_AQUCA|nr:hypothetical protein AQUCO_00400416v1 [Aquilegia coerulea]